MEAEEEPGREITRRIITIYRPGVFRVLFSLCMTQNVTKKLLYGTTGRCLLIARTAHEACVMRVSLCQQCDVLYTRKTLAFLTFL